jgi:SMC interacting uncharacterized protein involved in chromosome segregation
MVHTLCLGGIAIGLLMVTGSNLIAYVESVDLGARVTTWTVLGGLLSGLVIKGVADYFKTTAQGKIDIAKAEAAGIEARAVAEANAKASAERLEMKLQEEWDAVNAHTLKGQLAQLQQQNEKLQKTIEEDRDSTARARETLHAIRDEFNTATLQHRLQRDALIAELGAVRTELTKARQEITAFQQREHDRLNAMDAGQARQDVRIEGQDVKIEETKAATDENKAAIQDLIAGKSGEMKALKVDEPRDNP